MKPSTQWLRMGWALFAGIGMTVVLLGGGSARAARNTAARRPWTGAAWRDYRSSAGSQLGAVQNGRLGCPASAQVRTRIEPPPTVTSQIALSPGSRRAPGRGWVS